MIHLSSKTQGMASRDCRLWGCS